MSAWRDWLAMGRVANLPTVVSNVMLGCGLGIYARSWEFEVWRLVVPCVVGCLLYVGGCLLNDWWDRKWDAANKPERPVPSGRVNEGVLFAVAVGCLVAGVGCSVLLGKWVVLVAGLIVGAIVLYTWMHKKTAWGVVPMGVCRGLLYVLGFLGQAVDSGIVFGASHSTYIVVVGGGSGAGGFELSSDGLYQASFVGLPAMGLICYVAGLSLFARAEAQPVVPRGNVVVGIGLMGMVMLTHSVNWMPHYVVWCLVSLLPFAGFLIWGILRTRKEVGAGVSWLLATIGLVDLVVALPMGVALMGGGDEFAIGQGWIFPMVSVFGFGMALVLQRVAPAT